MQFRKVGGFVGRAELRLIGNDLFRVSDKADEFDLREPKNSRFDLDNGFCARILLKVRRE